MRNARRAAIGLALATVLALGVGTLVSAQRSPGQTIGGGQTWALTLELVAGLGISAAGAYLWRRPTSRTAGALMIATGAAVFLEQLPLPGDGGALPFTAGLVGGGLTSALAGSAALAVPGLGRRRWDTFAAGLTVAISGLGMGLLPAAVFSPEANGCFACARNLVLVDSDPPLYRDLVGTALTANALACGFLAVLVLWRAIARPEVLRSAGAPVVVAGATVAALGAVLVAHEVPFGVPEIDGTTHALWLGQCAVLAAAAGGVALFSLHLRSLRQRVASMVLKAQPSPHGLRSALRATLGDAQLDIVFPRVDGAPLDVDGQEAPPPSDDIAVAAVTRHGELIAQLRHTARLSHSPERLIEAAKGAGLALEHASLRVRLQAEISDIAASRTRIIEMGDAERRRLERNLHDGAQQRLISLAIDLSSAPGQHVQVAHARSEVQHALDSLRSIAHGIHPVSLSESGIVSATRELALSSTVPVQIDPGSDQTCPPSANAALYRAVLDCVRLGEREGNGSPVRVRIESRAQMAWLRVMAPGVDPSTALASLEAAADRVTALGGELVVRAQGDALVVEASVPCGS